MSLYCTADGYPAPFIHWRRGNRIVFNSAKFSIQTITSQPGFRSIPGLFKVTSIVTVNNINSDDVNDYSCRADNTARIPVFSSIFELTLNGMIIIHIIVCIFFIVLFLSATNTTN